MSSTGRHGGRMSPFGARVEYDIAELRDNAIAVTGGGSDDLRSAWASIAVFFHGRHKGRASDKAGARDMAMDRIAFDPPVSEPQRRAMFAAASGHSALGIPREVGAEFAGMGRHGGRGTVARDASHDYRDVVDMAAEFGARKARWQPGTPLWELWADRIMNLVNASRNGEASLKSAIADADRHAG